MNKEDNKMFYRMIGNSIQENKDKIEKLEKQLERCKLKNKKLQQQNKKYKEAIDKAINDIDLVIELIKQQPTEDDSWILGRLNAFKIILKEVE